MPTKLELQSQIDALNTTIDENEDTIQLMLDNISKKTGELNDL